MMMFLIHIDAEISILSCQWFLEKNILSLLSDQLMQNFDDLYWARILGREKFVSSTVDDTATILWATIQSHELMVELSKHDIKLYPSITSIFVRILITAKILEPLQEIYQMKRDIKVLTTKSDRHHDRMANLED